MAIALVSNVAVQSPDGNGVTTGSIDTSGATLLVMCVGRQDNTDSGPSDSKSNTWATAVTASGAGVKTTIYYVKNPTVGTSHTFSEVDSTSFPVICVAAFSGTDTTANVDQTNGSNAAADNIQAGIVTPTVDNEVVIASCLHINGSAATIDGGFTRTDFLAFSPGFAYGGAMAYLIQTTAASANPTWSSTSATAMKATNGTFKMGTAASFTYPQLERGRRGIARGIVIGV